ncbi:MAG: Uma2 family endonuclease [Cytophagales bacterium]|jgi:Uma2 family endonuclease|nr:Uma2 family endonuclease [Cytophagales bacterium]MCA6386561.1 Uma2 family endonuclease [Cytophagales bacterium]MCA6389929.1 Uma2 family endonuclease [Cytophagales bacterium]MCA6395546.1 Uma2 family endonuclease [Cytophagales bacterium]MCA6400088.1 Uma2 family endonuclease [Cytophagales bacterium]
MTPIIQNKKYTEQEYLELERKAEYKSEFFGGEIFAMAGTTNPHNIITVNFLILLGTKLRGKGCRPYGSDMRVHTPINSLYAYPDISVVCGEKKFLDNVFDTLLNPVFICEVLSKSTADYDTGGKFMRYRSIESLKEYWVISSLECRLQKFVKQTNGSWLLTETTNVNDTVLIESLGEEVPLSEVYFEVDFS